MINPLRLYPFFMADDPGGGAGEGGGEAGGQGEAGQGSVMEQALKGETQKDVPEWAKGLPEDMQKDPNIIRYQDLATYVKGQNELRKAFDGKIPGEESTPEQKQAFWGPLGTPASAEGYKIEKPANLPEGVQWSEDKLKQAAELAHSVNMPQDMFSAMVKLDTQNKIDDLANQEQSAKDVVAANTATLQKLWGGAFQQKVLESGLAVKSFATDDLYNRMEAFGLNSDPLFLEYNNEIAKGLTEGKRIVGSQPTGLVLTPDEAGKEQKALANSKDHPLHEAYQDRKHEDHQKALDEFARLGQLKRGNTPK